MFRNLFNKKTKIRFHSINHSVTDMYPIIHSSKLNREWVETEKDEYQQRLSRCPFHFLAGNEVNSIGKCPAINMIMNNGYVLVSPIDTTVCLQGPELQVQSRMLPGGGPWAEAHSPHVSKWMHDSTKDKSATQILKINTPWRVTCNNPNIIFLLTKVPFVNENRFSAVTGILDPKHSIEMNSQLFWHVEDGKTEVIKAGTPLCMYIPMDRRVLQTPFECVDADERDFKMEEDYRYNLLHSSPHHFTLNKKIANMKRLLKKHYNINHE